MDRNVTLSALAPKQNPVALRKESVDRNNDILGNLLNRRLSLSVRRAWIEIDAIAVQAANSSGRSP